MIRSAGEIGVRESNSTVRTIAQDVARRGFAVDAEKESRLRIHVRVTPAIENDPGDVPSRIEAAGREHVAELLAERALVLRERSAEQLRASSAPLLSDRQSGLCEQHFDGQHRW